MTNRVSFSPQDFQKKCNQAERDHESRKIEVLLERVRRQIAERVSGDAQVESPKPPVTALPKNRPAARALLFER